MGKCYITLAVRAEADQAESIGLGSELNGSCETSPTGAIPSACKRCRRHQEQQVRERTRLPLMGRSGGLVMEQIEQNSFRLEVPAGAERLSCRRKASTRRNAGLGLSASHFGAERERLKVGSTQSDRTSDLGRNNVASLPRKYIAWQFP